MKSSFVGGGLILLFGLGCAAESQRNAGGSDVSPAQSLLSLLVQAPSLRDQRLGAHRRIGHAVIKMAPVSAGSDRLETREENWCLDVDGKSGFHLVHEIGRQDGMEAIYQAPDLYVRPRYGKFVKRAPEGRETDRLRALADEALAGYLAVAKEAVTVLLVSENFGMRARLSLNHDGKASQSTSLLATDEWRRNAVIHKLNGEVRWQEPARSVIGADLSLGYRFARASEGSFEVDIQYREQTEAAQPIVAPKETVLLNRPRPMLDRETLVSPLRR